eukprot:6472942-Amphidinium_carterae.2
MAGVQAAMETWWFCLCTLHEAMHQTKAMQMTILQDFPYRFQVLPPHLADKPYVLIIHTRPDLPGQHHSFSV